jgi:hypothetical protein
MRAPRGSRIGHVALAAAPFVVAGLLVQPHRPAAGVCPPAGEGLTACTLQRTWVAWLTLVVAIGVGTHLVAWLGLRGVPGLVRRLRAGERIRRRPRPGPVADPALAAATWSWVADPAARAQAVSARNVAAVKRALPARPATVGPAVCGRCRELVPSAAFACACPWCGGVAVRTRLGLADQPGRGPRREPRRAAPIGAERRIA